MVFESRNPATGETVRTWPLATPEGTAVAMERAHRAQLAWRETPLAGRSGRMREVARLLRAEAPALGRLMAGEMGKPVTQGRGEAEKCAWVSEYYADHAERFLAPEPVATDASRSLVAYEPLGTILAIMPWNFPFWQVFRFAAPALMAGGAAILKHAPNVPGCALAIEDLFRRAGFPEGLFASLFLDVDAALALIGDPRVRGVTLTGSVRAGRSVAARAGECLKKTVLELGGSDPYLVLADADLSRAVEACAASRLINSGQSCIAAKRLVVVEPLRREFEERLVETMARAKVGNPLAEDTAVGPMARADLRDALHRQVEGSVRLGAKVLLGGEVPAGRGFFYPPTVLAGVRPGMPAHDEELFGPVAAVVSARDEEDAIRIANDTPFGLGAAVFTRDVDRGERVARRLEVGSAFVNAFVRSDPRLPFGGIKDSGYGRELGRHGILEWVNAKTVFVA